MKIINTLLLFAETIAFSIRLWMWKKFGNSEYVRKTQNNKLFYHNGRPTRYLHTIIFRKPDYVNRRMDDTAWHYYRQFKDQHWVTIKSQNKLN